MKNNLEARVERLEQRALMRDQNEPLEVVVTGAWRDADGVLHDDETHPPIILRIPGIRGGSKDRTEN
jgi:hypothetical protein